MPPKPICKCTFHKDTGDSSENPINISKSKKFKKSVLSNLVEKGHISARSNYLCKACYDEGEKLTEKSEINKKIKLERFTCKELCEKIAESELEESEIIDVAEALGKLLKNKLANHSDDEYNLRDKLENITANTCDVDPILKKFLVSLSGSTGGNAALLNAAETLIYLVNKKYIGKLNFCLSLISHFITGSKCIVELRSKYSPSGSYPTLLKYLETYTKEKNQFPQDKDVLVFFDNNQVLARNWRVKYDCKALVSVVTTLLCLIPPAEYQLQRNPELCPFKWLRSINVGDAVNLLSEDSMDMVFRTYRNEYIQVVLNEVTNEIRHGNELCENLDSETEKNRNVIFEGTNIKFEIKRNDPYDSVQANHGGKTEVKLLDPIDRNPCSYKSVGEVLKQIHTDSGREWVVVGCDGLPYILGTRLIDNTYSCTNCEYECSSELQLNEHINENHELENVDVKACKTFGRIFLIPGLGHFEINYIKAIFKLLWTVIFIDLAKLLGYRSIKALASCESATNHHKSWQIFEIFLNGTSREMLTYYVKQCLSVNQNPTVEGFYKWIAGSKSKNMQFMFKVIFTFCLALHVYRIGVRRNNKDYILSAMKKLSVLFYGLNMTQYMEIDLKHRLNMSQCPQEVKQFVEQCYGMSQSGHVSKCEGGDFILESKNKRMKMWLPPGVPTFKRWLRVCRNLESVEQMKEKIGNSGNDDIGDNIFRITDLDTEIKHWRLKLRQSQYLLKEGEHTAFSGKVLDEKLVQFDIKCTDNQREYYNNYPGHSKLERVFITPEERTKFNRIENKSNADIIMFIEQIIQQIEDVGGMDEADSLRSVWKRERTGKKTQLLTFYREATQTLEEVSEKYSNGIMRDADEDDAEV